MKYAGIPSRTQILRPCQHPGVLRGRDWSGQDLRTLVPGALTAESLFLVLKRSVLEERGRLTAWYRAAAAARNCPVLKTDAARPAGLRPEPAAPSGARTELLEALTQSKGRAGAASSKPGMDLQRPDSYQGGAGPDFNEHVLHKTILVGDSGVGKTSLLVQFDQGKFIPGSFSATVGIGFTNKVVTVDGVRVKLQIWDTAGQERFRSVTHAYYRDAQALLLLYDITNKSSFDNIRAWLTEIHEYAQRDVVIMLLGNKADMSSERVIRSEDGETLAREYGVPFLETSAKTGMNVELAFLAIAKELKYRAGQQADEPSFQIRDYVESQKKRSSCCSFV
ncbi:ras-related protein Rab-37 isoform X2 [Hylobates moloch]|uniref:ras-related protein Rab-37 isoform X2 n=2 Tax=Hylobatidae TaxID=9577 RepID=UPI001362DB65|nr:ras-related protein Rab-37 isoform X2 [Hylobates moloch]